MKKRILVILALALCLCAALMVALLRDRSISVGHCIKMSDGGCILVRDNVPICLSTRSGNKDMFRDLQTGDRILVVHGLVGETYPEQSRADLVLRLGKGSAEDISPELRVRLYYMGWMDDPQLSLEQARPVSISMGGTTAVFWLMPGWVAEDVPAEEGVGVRLRPEGQPEGAIYVGFRPDFGVCGTGLVTRSITLNSGLTGTVGTYDGGDLWSYIRFEESGLTVLNEGMSAWWDTHGAQAISMLYSLTVLN